MIQALPDSDLLMKGLVEQTLAGIYLIQGGVMKYANPECARIFGFDSPDEFVDRLPVFEMVAPEDREMVARRLWQRASGEVDEMRYQFTGLRRDGSRVAVEVHGRRAIFGGKAAVIGMLIDISARVRAEGAKADLLRVVGHELRTPLHQIKSLSTILRRAANDDRTRTQLDQLDSATARLNDLIEAILAYSSLERGMVETAMAAFVTSALLERIRSTFAPRAEAKGMTLTVSIGRGADSRLLGDAEHLAESLACLVDNAIKFSSQGQVSIVATTRRDGQGGLRLRVAVVDQGPGVAPATQSGLFELFRQGDSSSTRRFGGVGLGLATCRRLATLMGGDVGYEPVEAGGSRFWIEVPALPAESPSR